MIPEYFMHEAERMDNTGIAQGYPTGPKLKFLNCIDADGEGYLVPIKSETVRRVKVPVKRERTAVGDYRCPNCNAAFVDGLGPTPFCGNCGMGIIFPKMEAEK